VIDGTLTCVTSWRYVLLATGCHKSWPECPEEYFSKGSNKKGVRT
jgi:hypothetical protein